MFGSMLVHFYLGHSTLYERSTSYFNFLTTHASAPLLGSQLCQWWCMYSNQHTVIGFTITCITIEIYPTSTV